MLISSKDNANVKFFNKLSQSKKARNEYGLFPLEGYRLILDAIKENVELHCVFISENAIVKYSEALDLLERNGFSDKVYFITEEVEKKLSDTVNPQGIYAVCKKLDKILSADTILSNGKYIILHELQDPGNLGTIIRTADAVGIDGIFLTGNSCDIYNPKVVRSTMGSLFRMSMYCEEDIRNVLEIFKEKNIISYAAVIDNDACSLSECKFSNGSVVLIGNEGNGLPDEISSLCDSRLTIKMNGNINSLNAAMATGIIMWEMFRQ